MLGRMRKLLVVTAAIAGLAAFPRDASAGFLLEGSVGSGAQLSPSVERTPVNVMLAPGWGFAGLLKLELGLLGNLGDVQNSKFDLELRPMVVVSPPLVPLYLRAIFAVQNLIDGPTTYAYGGALGLSFSLFGAGLFVEAGVLPRNVKVDVVTNVPVVGTAAHATRDEFRWFAEGRLGAFYEF
jgi:hypothetical protein